MRRKIVSLVLIIVFIFTIPVYAEIKCEDENYSQKQIEKIVAPPTNEETETKVDVEEREQITTPTPLYSNEEFKYHGVIYWNDLKWTWYSQKVLPGGGLDIPGRHVDENNYVCDENDYICLASSDMPKGTVIDTPLGKKGKVYDCGCPSGVVDVYTNF